MHDNDTMRTMTNPSLSRTPLLWLMLVMMLMGALHWAKTASTANSFLAAETATAHMRNPLALLEKSNFAQKDTPGASVAAKGGMPGKLVGSIDNLTAAEQSFVREMVAGGRTVEIIPTAAGRTADFFIDGVKYELKTMSNVASQTADGLSASLSRTIMGGRGQSGNIIIDARGQAGMTAEIAERGIGRAFGADARTGSKIQNITVITPEGTVFIPRKP